MSPVGLEKTCDVRYAGKTYAADAHLEPAELRLRGALKLAVAVGVIQSAEAKAGVLKVKWPGGALDLHLGKDAEAWALKIRYPRGRLDKLGIKPNMRVAVVGLEDAAFLKELGQRTGDLTVGKPKKDTEAVVVALSKTADLPKLTALSKQIVKNGMIWVVWPKGRKEFREDDVRAYGPRAGLVDVKVMSFSDTLSGLKLVIPVKDR
jgi:hypothetical protein